MAEQGKIIRYLDMLFFVLVLATFVCYFALKSSSPRAFIGIGIAAIIVRVISYILRFYGRSKQ